MLFIVPNNPKTNKTMGTVTETYDFIVGIDTHAKKHVFTILNSIGELVGRGECRVLPKDFTRFHLLIRKKTDSEGQNRTRILFVIEGTSGYGETLTKFLMGQGEDVCEYKPHGRAKSRRAGSGKNDQLDSENIARDALHLPIAKLICPRTGDSRKMLRIALSSRSNITKQQVMDRLTLIALVRSIDIGVDARRPLSLTAIRNIAGVRARSADAPHEAVARAESKRLAASVMEKEQLKIENARTLSRAVESLAPGMTDLIGVGPVTAAQIICSYSHKGRIKSPEAFAMIAGVAPIPASSGNTMRHRLNKFGDRALNAAINMIVLNRMRIDEPTKTYMNKRTAQGKSKKEIKRALKRYVARDMFKFLETCEIGD